MRDLLTTLLDSVGVAVIVFGVALIYFPAAIILAGLALIGASYLLSTNDDDGIGDA